jgi:TRAP-type C4-dicarboxylate transport system substrate-binding protein
MSFRNFRLSVLTALTAAVAFAGAANAQTKWNLPAAYPADNFHSENLAAFAKDVAAGSGGKLEITVHPNASLFKAPEIKRAVQTGQAQAGEVLISLHENEDPVFGVDVVPFLATSFADAKKLWAASRPQIEKKLASQGLVVLFAVPWPPQGIYAKKDLNTIDDMKGLRWRAYNAGTSRIAEIVGAQPVTIQAAELPQALATGTVNAFMTSGATGYDSKAWETMTHFYAGLDSEERHLREQGRVRRARQAHAGSGDESRRRCRSARLESRRGKDQLVHRPAEVARYEGSTAGLCFPRRVEEDWRPAHC